jgi:hypothetical protein
MMGDQSEARPPVFCKIAEGIQSQVETFLLLNRHSGGGIGIKPDNLWAWEWWEIEAASFDYFLDILPPLAMPRGGFVMCEFTSGNITSAFFKICGRFFHCSLDWSVPDAFDHARMAIATAEGMR